MKYGVWNISQSDPEKQKALCVAGYSPLTAAVLCARGHDTVAAARAYLSVEAELYDPLLLREMERAVARVRLALETGEKIAVFGDYDVDGITATCLLTDFLRQRGGDVIPYIPARIEEGYGLNEMAIHSLAEKGIRLIVTVDCGITANEEATLCREMGIDLVITDHHECKEPLPEAVAVVDPHRKDCTYPHQQLAGVGIAFKLAAAISGDQQAVMEEYCDLFCLGTVADVMPLHGENRTVIAKGLAKLTARPRVGVRALLEECNCDTQAVTASMIGYTLAPRINAAGRMGEVPTAMELFVTEDRSRAAELAEALCAMNRKRQAVEMEIYRDAAARLEHGDEKPAAIVLAGEDWHQGVVGIVASRLAEEFSCPTFLICMDGEKGKASSRSYGGFNLFGALEELAPLLEGYGGHELAAGFTIRRENIEEFRRRIEHLADEFRRSGQCRTALEVDCEIAPELLSVKAVEALDELEPCGAGCPRPIFCMKNVLVEQVTPVGGGRHLRLNLCKNIHRFNGIFFSTTMESIGVTEGDTVDIAFQPQVNEYRSCRVVQLNLVDLRQSSPVRESHERDRELYQRFRMGERLPASEALSILPGRKEFVRLWKFLTIHAEKGVLEDTPECLARRAARSSDLPCSLARTMICLDVFEELGLLQIRRHRHTMQVQLREDGEKVDLQNSGIMKTLRSYLEGSPNGGA